MKDGSSRRPRVLICDPIAQVGVDMLQEHAEVEIKKVNHTELLTLIADYEAIVVRSATKVTADVIEHGLNLKVIARAGAGLDNVDVTFAQERGIEVVNSPDANTLAVAEHTLGLILSLARHLPRGDAALKQGEWAKKQLMGTGLAGKTLGIVGFGRIGREVATRAQAFGMQVIVNQRRPTPELNLALGVESVDLDDLLQQADFVSLHVPSKPETQNLISQAQLTLMKPTAYLINTARGTVIDEAALLTALNEGQIAGAGLDVFQKEPAIDSELARHPRVIATPHIAASTADAQQAAAITVAQKIIDILRDVEVEPILPVYFVPTEQVIPHEHVDPRRVQRLTDRLQADGVLNDPPIVTKMNDHYIVLDGATRFTALKEMGYDHMAVQIIPSNDDLRLYTWHHIICNIEIAPLLTLLSSIIEVVLVETTRERVAEQMFEENGLCYLQLADKRVFLVKAAPDQKRLNAVNALTNGYIAAAHVNRTVETNLISLQREYPALAALVVFQEYTVTQILQMAEAGQIFPAGITRFVIPGRVLHLNIPLTEIKADKSLRQKNRWLQEQLVEKIGQGKMRYYEEPIYLLED